MTDVPGSQALRNLLYALAPQWSSQVKQQVALEMAQRMVTLEGVALANAAATLAEASTLGFTLPGDASPIDHPPVEDQQAAIEYIKSLMPRINDPDVGEVIAEMISEAFSFFPELNPMEVLSINA